MDQTFLQDLARYQIEFPGEGAVCELFQEFMGGGCSHLDRGRADGHLTGSAWIVCPEGREVLLTLHGKLGRWLQLGGHGEGERHPKLTALREAKEESGLADISFVSEAIFDLDRHLIPARGPEAAHWHYDVRYCFRADDKEIRRSSESRDLRWFPVEEIAEWKNAPSLARMARKWKERFTIR